MLLMHRVFAMPDRATFRMTPVRALLIRYVLPGQVWADPFAGFNSPAEWTNDLNPESPATYHLPALEFAERIVPDGLDGVLFDPPYSPRQISEVYQGIGRTVGMEDTQNGHLYATVRDALAPKVRPGGVAISFGWNSTGFGEKRGFTREHVVLINHGAAHNDTIVVVERKAGSQERLL